jgi:hypothetical protein
MVRKCGRTRRWNDLKITLDNNHPIQGFRMTAMSESVDGFSVAATRQNAGRPLAACTKVGGTGGLPAGMGIVNAPASTAHASVIVVFGKASDARLSHVWPAA